MRWPWVVRSKDNRTITIIAPHQTPESRKLKNAVLFATVLFGFYKYIYLKSIVTPFAITHWPEKTASEINDMANGLTILVIGILAAVMISFIFPIIFRKLFIIKINPEQIRVWHILWFRTYDRQRIGGFHLEQHVKADIEHRENQTRGQKPRYMYRDSVQIIMDYNNMPVIITSVYGAMQGRMLLGRIQAIYGETTHRQVDGHGTGKY